MKVILRSFILSLLLASPAWAFPDNAVLDDFTSCTNDATPPNGNWTNAPLVGATSANVECRSTAMAGVTAGSGADAYYDVTTFGHNCEAYAKILNVTDVSYAAVYCNLANIGSGTTDGYEVDWDDSASEIYINRIDNGGFVTLAGPISQTIAVGDQWGIRVAGNQICAWYKVGAGAWTQLGCATDATYSAGGYIGVTIQNSVSNTAIVDDFGGGNAFPDNAVLDDFTGCTNNATPPNSKWTNAPLRGTTTTNLECQSTAVAEVGTAGEGEAYYNMASYGASCEAYATIVSITGADRANVYCNLANIGADTTDGYYVQWVDATSEVFIGRLDDGNGTDLTPAISQTIAAGDKWGIRHVGDQVCAWYKVGAGGWTEIGCRTDTTYTAGGNIGLSISNTANDTAIVDDFGGGTVGATRRAVAPLVFE